MQEIQTGKVSLFDALDRTVWIAILNFLRHQNDWARFALANAPALKIVVGHVVYRTLRQRWLDARNVELRQMMALARRVERDKRLESAGQFGSPSSSS